MSRRLVWGCLARPPIQCHGVAVSDGQTDGRTDADGRRHRAHHSIRTAGIVYSSRRKVGHRARASEKKYMRHTTANRLSGRNKNSSTSTRSGDDVIANKMEMKTKTAQSSCNIPSAIYHLPAAAAAACCYYFKCIPYWSIVHNY